MEKIYRTEEGDLIKYWSSYKKAEQYLSNNGYKINNERHEETEQKACFYKIIPADPWTKKEEQSLAYIGWITVEE